MKLYYSQSFVSGLFLAFLIVIINALPNDGLVFPQLINSGHSFVFFFANLFLLKLILGVSDSFRKILFICLFSIFVGFLIECIQPYVGRNRSALDFYYDVVGVLFSAIFFFRINTSPKKPTTILLILFFSLATAFPVFKMYVWWQINHTPTLLNFEREWEYISLSRAEGVSIEKTPSVFPFNSRGNTGKVSYGMSGIYPGFGLEYPRSDWTDFSELTWEIASSNDHPIDLNLRIHDSEHNQEFKDRFNHKFTVMPGLNAFKLELNQIKNGPEFRQLDMTKITNMKFFIIKPNTEITLYFDNMELH
jgi:hypothetical protein